MKIKGKTLSELLLKVIYLIYQFLFKKCNTYIANPSDYTFDDRSAGADNLMIILAGYQPYYWDGVFERVQKCKEQFHQNIDICVCCSCAPESSREELSKICVKNNWSFLYLNKNKVTQVQNTAIALHGKAKMIFKIDEDIILCDHYFDKMIEAYEYANNTLPYNVGFMGPLLNINAFCTPIFLSKINKIDEFQSKFGKYKLGGLLHTKEDFIHDNAEWARFIWQNSIPFDSVSKSIDNGVDIAVCPIRYSIGAILFNRSFIEKNGYLPVGFGTGMADDEVFLNDKCNEGMYSIAVATNIFVGHLGFGHQKETCKQFYFAHQQEIRK